MIEQLNGIHEIVNYKENTNIRLYDNVKNENYPAHWHTPIEVIMPITNGYTIILGDTITELAPSDILFIGPGVVHALNAPPTGRRLILQIETSLLRQLKDIDAILSLISPAITITPKSSPTLHKVLFSNMMTIAKEYNASYPFYETAIYSIFMDMLVYIGRNTSELVEHFHTKNQIPKEHMDKFMSICTYISAHCTEDLNLDEIAQIAGFSKYHFTRLFKQYTNTTFYKYLTQKRIEHAEQLLIDPDLSITEVALNSGFSNQSAFIRMFKMMKSCTPTEYRNMYDHS